LPSGATVRALTTEPIAAFAAEAAEEAPRASMVARLVTMAERKIVLFTQRAWGGRKARCRGLARVSTDVVTRAGVLNFA
jgi:hypothetical protein